MRHALVSALIAAVAACAPAEPELQPMEVALPQALLSCATAPELEARLWVSGFDDPCPLDVDLDAGSTSGTCDVTPGVKRTLTLDWFTVVDHGGDFELLLAQARGTLDLREPKETAQFKVKEDDIHTNACLDMHGDSQDGAQVIEVDGVDVPPCDVDESCNGEEGACTNLGELCAGADPFNGEVEP